MSVILLIDDDKNISSSLSYFLETEGFTVDVAGTAKGAKETLANKRYDLILLDITLPDESGYEIFKWMNKSDITTHVIFLSALDDEINIVRGLEIGAEDYVPKPFKPRELLARINKVLKRTNTSNIVLYQDITINNDLMKIYKGNSELFLSLIEFQLINLFIKNKNIILSRNQLMEIIWDSNENFVNDNTLTVTIKRLRKKLKDIDSTINILTVRGVGYRLK